jgi:hypothetical protein
VPGGSAHPPVIPSRRNFVSPRPEHHLHKERSMLKMDNQMKNEKQSSIEQRLHHIAQQAKELEKQLRLARGTKDTASTEYRVGDEGPTPELMAVIKRMLEERPLTFQALLDETGARANRIKGCIMRLQREGVSVVNLGNEQKALWFIPDDAVLQRITRAQRKRK